jgi:hypothetical protein
MEVRGEEGKGRRMGDGWRRDNNSIDDDDDDNNEMTTTWPATMGKCRQHNEMGKRMIMEVRGGWRRWQDNDSIIKLRD